MKKASQVKKQGRRNTAEGNIKVTSAISQKLVEVVYEASENY